MENTSSRLVVGGLQDQSVNHFGGGVCVGHVIGPSWLLEVCCFLFVVPGGVDPMVFCSLEQLFL